MTTFTDYNAVCSVHDKCNDNHNSVRRSITGTLSTQRLMYVNLETLDVRPTLVECTMTTFLIICRHMIYLWSLRDVIYLWS